MTSGRLKVCDPLFGSDPVDMPLEVLLGKPPRLTRTVASAAGAPRPFDTGALILREAAYRVLRLPTVADKTFLITIGDRTVGGLISRDQMVGPWQVPVSDVAVTLVDYQGCAGEALAIGERSPWRCSMRPPPGAWRWRRRSPTSWRRTSRRLSQIRLSANWMAACGERGEDAALYATVRAVAKELCPQLGIAIPVGKDSLSMRTDWREADGAEKCVIAPVSLVVSAFAPVTDAAARSLRRCSCTRAQAPCGWSTWPGAVAAWAGRRSRRCMASWATSPPISTSPAACCSSPRRSRSCAPRGCCAPTTTAPTAACSSRWWRWRLPGIAASRSRCRGRHATLAQLFAEEPGVVMQVLDAHEQAFTQVLARHGLLEHAVRLGVPQRELRMRLRSGELQLDESWTDLRRAWSETSWQLRRLRDDPQCADEEFAAHSDERAGGLSVELSFDPQEDIAAPYVARSGRPAVAILREQGVNSHMETAAAFAQAGFTAHDVHMSDLLGGRRRLAEFAGLVACGGFSYGDVLGAGEGWAKSILFNDARASSSCASSHGPTASRSASAMVARCSPRSRA